MIEFGKTLREAREAKGYSVSQLAEITHILPQIIENIEREDFTRIVAPIYGRGFVKLYCETVGLEAKPLVAEFMEIYNGNRQPAIRLKEVEAEDPAPAPQPPIEEPPAAPEPQQAVPEPPAEIPQADPEPPPTEEPLTFNFDVPPNRFVPAEEPPPRNPQPSTISPKPFASGPDDLPFPDEPAEPKRDYRLPGYSMPEVPRRFWRFGILVAAAVVIVALLVLCSRALYRATMQVPETETAQAETSNPQPSTPNPQPSALNPQPSTPRAPRKGVAVPPLYID